FPRALPFDRFENIGTLDASLIRRSAWNHRDHGGISEALRDGCTDIRFGAGIPRLVILVFFGAQIARIGIQSFKQNVKSALGHLTNVWLFHVILVHVAKHFAVDLHLAVGAVPRGGTDTA